MVSWPNSCCCVHVFFCMCVCDICIIGRRILFEEKFWGLLEHMLKFLKVIFPIWKTQFLGVWPHVTTTDQILGIYLRHRQNGGGLKSAKGVAKKIYYWNLSCHCSTDWVCNVWLKIWAQYENMWELEWPSLPRASEGLRKLARLGPLVRAGKQL